MWGTFKQRLRAMPNVVHKDCKQIAVYDLTLKCDKQVVARSRMQSAVTIWATTYTAAQLMRTTSAQSGSSFHLSRKFIQPTSA